MDGVFSLKPVGSWLWLAAPAAVIGCAVPAAGQVFATETQALEAIFGQHVVAKREVKSLTDSERKKLEQSSQLHFPERSYTFLVAENQGKLAGYALVLDEIGKTEPITLMVGMSPEGKVIDAVVMVFRESRGWEVKEKRFLRQFRGKRVGDPIQVERDIINYSGATLSSKALARGVKRALLLLQEFYPPAGGRPGASTGTLVAPMLPVPMATSAGYEGSLALYRQARYRMGTLCEIRLWTHSAADAVKAFAAGFEEITRLDRIFSNYRDDSELAHVNAAAFDGPVPVSPELWNLTRYARRSWRRSRGTFDITVAPLVKAWGFWEGKPRVPSAEELAESRARVGTGNVELCPNRRAIHFRVRGMELDFGGLAKGYAVERAARLACKAGALAVLVNFGGSSLCAVSQPVAKGEKSFGSAGNMSSGLEIGEWPVGIADASVSSKTARYLILPSGWSLSTSGSSERFFRTTDGRMLSHIIDPRTGWPIEGSRSASVMARSALVSEALAKPLLLLEGPAREDFLSKVDGGNWILLQGDHETAAAYAAG